MSEVVYVGNQKVVRATWIKKDGTLWTNLASVLAYFKYKGEITNKVDGVAGSVNEPNATTEFTLTPSHLDTEDDAIFYWVATKVDGSIHASGNKDFDVKSLGT